MAVECKKQTPLQAIESLNPEACEARVEVEVFSQYRKTEIAGGEINCLRCNLHRRFDSVGTEQEISGDVQNKITETIRKSCLKLRPSGQNIPQELLPQVRFL